MKVNINLVILQTLALFILFALSLFIPTGSMAWLAGWIFLILFLSFFTSVNIWLYKNNPGLLQERMNLGKSDQKGWDKILFPVLLALPFAWLAFISLDAV